MARFFIALCLPILLLLVSGNLSNFALSAEPETGKQAKAGDSGIPPVPEGTPEQMLDYIRTIRQVAEQPASREEMMKSMQAIATATMTAADRALSQLKNSDDLFDEAATAKLQSLMMLSRLGDPDASSSLRTFAASLIEGPSPALATEAKRLLLVQEAQELFSKRDLTKAPAIIEQAGALLAANPDDTATAGLAMQLASAFEHMPGGESLSKQAYETFGPLFRKSTNESIQQMAEQFPRNTSATFSPWQPNGNTLAPSLSGKPFDAKYTYRKKLFWSTSGQPGVAIVWQRYQSFSRLQEWSLAATILMLFHQLRELFLSVQEGS